MDFLINRAGGNSSKATTSKNVPFFDLPEDAVRFVVNLNFMGTFLASQVFGKIVAEQGEREILNIASMNAIRPLTCVPAYSAANRGGQSYAMAFCPYGPGVFAKNPRSWDCPRLLHSLNRTVSSSLMSMASSPSGRSKSLPIPSWAGLANQKISLGRFYDCFSQGRGNVRHRCRGPLIRIFFLLFERVKSVIHAK